MFYPSNVNKDSKVTVINSFDDLINAIKQLNIIDDDNSSLAKINSPTEIEFLKLASSDMTYKEIAQKMNMTPRAIDGYRDTLFDKLEVKSRVGLAIYGLKNGIVTF